MVTGVASGVTDVSATLNGMGEPNGGSVSSCEVEYGTSPTLVGAAKASCGSPGSGSSPVAVSASVTGLTETDDRRLPSGRDQRGRHHQSQQHRIVHDAPDRADGGDWCGVGGDGRFGDVEWVGEPERRSVSSCEVEYGTSPTLVGAAKASCGSPGSGSNPVAVFAAIAGLSPITTYYFRLDATNAGGTSKAGSVETFTTLPEAPTVVTGSASAVTDTSATLNGTVNPNGGTVSSCEVEYGASPTLGGDEVSCGSPGSGSSPVAVSASVTGLTSTMYYFRVDATNAGGTT